MKKLLFAGLASLLVALSAQPVSAAPAQIRRTVTRQLLCTEGKTVHIFYNVISVGAPGRIMHYLSGTNIKPGTGVKVHVIGRTIGVNGRVVKFNYLVKPGEIVTRSTLTGSDYSVVWFLATCS